MVADKDDFDTIQPAEIALTRPAPFLAGGDSHGETGRSMGDRWIAVALIVGVLLALMVIFVLPEWVRHAATPIAVETRPDTAVTRPVKESPFLEAQLAQARREAQEVLAKILDSKARLEQRQVQHWAAEEFARATLLAETGDVQYRDRQFSEALQSYRLAQQLLAELEEQFPIVLRQTLDKGFAALAAGQADVADAAFSRALEFAPDNSQAQLGAARSSNLPRLLSLLEEARIEQSSGDFEAAARLLDDAMKLDPEYLPTQKALAEVTGKIRNEQFSRAMSEGFQTLEAGQLQRAIASFKTATGLKPGDQAAANALSQARNRAARAELSQLLETGKRSEQEEQWHQAVASYQQVVDRDSSIIEARVGLLRARARAQLDDDLAQYISNPERLSSDAVYQHASKVLADARAVANSGPRLTAQIGALTRALKQAVTPVTISLVSDNLTTVTLLRVGVLGSFTEKTLTLKPGSYVATGTRAGFRDVRIEFQVGVSGPRDAVAVICREPV